MSISSALNNAVSGLSAVSRMADVVSSNTANALTEGYARREISLSSSTTGGVLVNGVSRQINETLVKENRLADAALANASAKTAFYSNLEAVIGASGATGSLGNAISGLETALITASASPESTTALDNAVAATKTVATKLNTISDSIQQTRLDADKSIDAQVNRLNEALLQTEDLNKAITRSIASGIDASSLIDQRQLIIDEISSIVPVQTVPREGSQVALYTTGGLALLDRTAVEVGFSSVGQITADMTLASGALSGLTVNGLTVSTADTGAMGGGTLGASFAIRDSLATNAQQDVDAIARNLIERFEGSAVDTTLSSGDPGLFTDAGAALDTTDEIGLAGRISLNTAVDPASGGQTWRLRDGLGAASAGASGDASLIVALEAALTRDATAASGNFGSTPQSTSELASQFLSLVSSSRQAAEGNESYATARQQAASQQLLSQGVDTDQEMQILLQLETSYSANAKVLAAVDQMMQTILEL